MTRRFLCVALLLVVGAVEAAGQTVRHPLDPISFEEYWVVLDALHADGKLDRETRFSLLTLEPPDKTAVWAWEEGSPIPRAAFVVVRQGAKSFETVVELTEGEILSWEELDGEQPSWTEEEFESMADVVLEHPEFIAALKKRGYEDFTFLACDVGPPGYFGTEEHQGRRVGHVECRDIRYRRNGWTRGLEGLTAVVDMNTKEVLRVVDEGVVPLPDTSADYDPDSIGPVRAVPGPISMEQPLGAGYRMDGHVVEWQKWRFHVRPDQRVGTIISTVTYRDGDRARPILYEGHLSEIFVPYMDPAFSWYVRNFLDSGEYPVGGLIKPLESGRDCPENASYLDMTVIDDRGRPKAVSNAICIFERYAGDPSWRHGTDQGIESRARRDLVVRSVAVLGNYDYLFDWAFLQNGSIRVSVGATGIAEAKVVLQADATEAAATEIRDDAYGRFVDRHIVAVNHDHYFSYRIDFDVDGPVNSFTADRLVTKMLPEDHPRRSIWVVEPHPAERESQAKMKINYDRPALWRVLSEETRNHVGYPTSYQLMPVKNGNTLLSADDYPRRRAGFIDHHLWVTPYRADERYSAGDYPTLSTPGQGLPEWTAADRPIANTDIVLWYTIGMHHVVRVEDWPVMPVLWHDFEIRPFDFFDRNPALDLPGAP